MDVNLGRRKRVYRIILSSFGWCFCCCCRAHIGRRGKEFLESFCCLFADEANLKGTSCASSLILLPIFLAKDVQLDVGEPYLGLADPFDPFRGSGLVSDFRKVSYPIDRFSS